MRVPQQYENNNPQKGGAFSPQRGVEYLRNRVMTNYEVKRISPIQEDGSEKRIYPFM